MPETRSIGEILRDAEAGRLDLIFAKDRVPYDLVDGAERFLNLLDERRVDFMLVGGLAMLNHGEQRNSLDMDLIVPPDAPTHVPELKVHSHDAHIVRTQFERVRVDLLLTTDRVFEAVHSRLRMRTTYGSREVVCASAAGMFLLKTYAVAAVYRGAGGDIYLHELDLSLTLTTSPASADDALTEMRRLFHGAEFALMQRIVEETKERARKREQRRLQFLANQPN